MHRQIHNYMHIFLLTDSVGYMLGSPVKTYHLLDMWVL